MGMLLRVTVTGKIQISLRLLRSPLLDLSRKCLLSRETLRPGGSIGVFTHHPLLYSPPNSPETNFTGRSKESFLILSLIHGRSLFHSGWLFSEMKGLYVHLSGYDVSRIVPKIFQWNFDRIMHSPWFQYNAEFISRIKKFILLARQIVFSSCALLSHNGNLTQIPTRGNDARELSFPPVLIEK